MIGGIMKSQKKAPELCRCSSDLGKQNAEFELEILSVDAQQKFQNLYLLLDKFLLFRFVHV